MPNNKKSLSPLILIAVIVSVALITYLVWNIRDIETRQAERFEQFQHGRLKNSSDIIGAYLQFEEIHASANALLLDATYGLDQEATYERGVKLLDSIMVTGNLVTKLAEIPQLSAAEQQYLSQLGRSLASFRHSTMFTVEYATLERGLTLQYLRDINRAAAINEQLFKGLLESNLQVNLNAFDSLSNANADALFILKVSLAFISLIVALLAILSIQLYRNKQREILQHNEQLTLAVSEQTASLRQAKEEAEHANAAKTHFLSRVSHEFRTPLNGILGFAQLLQFDDSNLQTEQREGVEHIVNSGQHLLQLIEEVLDITGMESGHIEADRDLFSPAQVIRQSLQVLTPVAKQTGIALHCELAELPDMYSDERRFRQIILNLVSNAIKYNRPEGTVNVEATVENDNQFKIVVADTGIGISKEFMHKVFEPFQRQGGSSSHIQGTGMGLTITKMLVELLDGNIDFSSEVGIGTQFTVTLPIPDVCAIKQSKAPG